ncbi:unnamed protein product [Phytophthora fragariaefolia]|uniref:Unnamed protein product n=1 Tax=Phytophthora fragariaefolia TaxID=1490495 RepID=A0A9W6XV68_9STRA|nr:unnamed protein product [Phytophthora fragariaefolia]
MVNAITLIMEYAMPLVDDLLTEMESYLWLCSLDAAIHGYIAKIADLGSASTTDQQEARGDRRAPVPFIEERNAVVPRRTQLLRALFIQGLALYGAVLYQLKDEDFAPGSDLSVARGAFAALRRKVAEALILRHFDGSKDVYIMLYANEWALSSTLMQMHDEVLHPVRFCGRVLKENELNYHPAQKEVLALLQVLKVCYALLAGKTLHVYTRFSTLEWVFQSKSLFGRSVQFAVFLSQWHLKTKRVRERDIEFAKLLQSSITPFVSLDEEVAPLAPPSKGSATVRMAPHLLYASITRDYDGYLSQHNELTAQLKSTRYLHVVRVYNAAADSLATEALESQVTKVALSESWKTELKALNKIPEVLYVDEQALAETDLPAQRMQPIPQTETHAVSQTVEEPQVTAVTRNQSRQVRFAESTRHRPTSQEAVTEVDNLPADQVSPISPQGGPQRSAGEGTRNLETTLDEPARADPMEASEREDPTTVQTERIRRLADRFVLDEDGLLQYVGKGRKLDEVGEHEPQLHLGRKATVPHDDLGEGGHRPSPIELRLYQQMHVLI